MQSSAAMKLCHLRFVVYACALACPILSTSVLAASPAAPASAKASSPDVGFQVLAERDVVNRGSSFDVVLSITNRSEIPLKNLQLLLLPKDSKIHFSLPTLNTICPFGSQHTQVEGHVNDAADFQTYHLVFVLQYTWKAGVIQHSSTQNATLSVQINRQFEEEAKGLPGGTAALLYLILPVMTIFLAYEIVNSWRQGKLKIPEFKAEYIAPAFLFAIILNFLLIFEWKHDQSFLYATPQRFASSLLLLAAVGAVIPSICWLTQGYRWYRYTFRKKDTKEKYLKKVLHQSETGEVHWTTAKVGGVDWKGALLEQPNGAKVLGACLQVSPKLPGNPTAEELKEIVDEQGNILEKKKLLNYVKTGAVTLDFRKRITQSGKQIDKLFVESEAITLSNEGATPERIVKFVS